MSEEFLVRNCAPTLAGLKTANLFSCPCAGREELARSVRQLNGRLNGKGLRIVPLRFSQGRALIYLYRPGRLQADMADAQAALRRIDRQDLDRDALEREASNLEVWCYACIDKRITLQRVLGLLPA